MNQIRNVVFDLGGVLVNLDIERCRAAFRSLGMEAIARILNPSYPAEMIGRLEGGQITFHEACEEMRCIADRPDITDEQIEWAYGEFLLPIEAWKFEMLRDLKARGLRLYVLSNNNPASMRYIHRMFDEAGMPMASVFEKLYLSYEMKILKPSEEIFRRMMADGAMNPDETLFIDDGQRNVDAARRLGLQVYMPANGEDYSTIFRSVV